MSIAVRNVTQDVSGTSWRSTTSSLEIPQGRLVALLGPVGLGEDDAAADHRRTGDSPTSGSVQFDGHDITDRTRARAPRRVRLSSTTRSFGT